MIERLTLTPPISEMWSMNPISSFFINKEERSKLIVLNDYNLKYLKEPDDSINLMKQTSNVELLLSSDLSSISELKKLVTTYFCLEEINKYSFNKNILLLFVRAWVISSDYKAKNMLKKLKEWFEFSNDQLVNEFAGLKDRINDEQIKKAVSVFSQSPGFTNSIIKFLWSVHGHQAINLKNCKFVSIEDNKVSVIPVSLLKQSRKYYYLVLRFAFLHKINVILDSDLELKSFLSKLNYFNATIYLFRYYNSPSQELNYLASNANDVWSCSQNTEQSVFCAWVASNCSSALRDFSLGLLNRIAYDTPYLQFTGRYLIVRNETLSLAKFDDQQNDWIAVPFDVRRIIKQTADKNKLSLNDVADSINSLKKIIEETSNKEDENKESDITLTDILNVLKNLKDRVDQVLDKEDDSFINSDIGKQFDNVLSEQSELSGSYQDFDS